MGSIKGFMTLDREEETKEAPEERIRHFHEFVSPLTDAAASRQGARCMDCGTPFCSWSCPLNNVIPDVNDLVMKGRWDEAWQRLSATSNFPEWTGRVCPALCEAGCVLNRVKDAPVSIRAIERLVADRAWADGRVVPMPAEAKTGHRVAVIGSGPAGLACAQQLARAGHTVEVFEKADAPGGLLRYGIPDFKLGKDSIDRRIAQMQAEGVVFHTGVCIGEGKVPAGVINTAKKRLSAAQLRRRFDAVVLAAGAEVPRDLKVPGREAAGVHFAMALLTGANRKQAGQPVAEAPDCRGADVVIVGGGDTGSDCAGTALRQGARSVTQLDLKPQPPLHENKLLEWPAWPYKLRTSSSHEEGTQRLWSVQTKAILTDDQGAVRAVQVVDLKWHRDPATGAWSSEEVPETVRELSAQRVFLAMGFTGTSAGLPEAFGLKVTPRGNAPAEKQTYMTAADGVFACGDCRSGQSLVVRAMSEGRACAEAVDRYLNRCADGAQCG